MGVAIHVLCDFVTLTLTVSLYFVENYLKDGFGTISEWKIHYQIYYHETNADIHRTQVECLLWWMNKTCLRYLSSLLTAQLCAALLIVYCRDEKRKSAKFWSLVSRCQVLTVHNWGDTGLVTFRAALLSDFELWPAKLQHVWKLSKSELKSSTEYYSSVTDTRNKIQNTEYKIQNSFSATV